MKLSSIAVLGFTSAAATIVAAAQDCDVLIPLDKSNGPANGAACFDFLPPLEDIRENRYSSCSDPNFGCKGSSNWGGTCQPSSSFPNYPGPSVTMYIPPGCAGTVDESCPNGNLGSNGSAEGFEGTFPGVGNSGVAGIDNSVAFLVGGKYVSKNGAEVEGKLVVLDDFVIEPNGVNSVVRVGFGSQIIPEGGQVVMTVGGDLIHRRNQNTQLDLSPGGDVEIGGILKEEGSGAFVTTNGGTITENANINEQQYLDMFTELEARSNYWSTLYPNGKFTPAVGHPFQNEMVFEAGDDECLQVFHLDRFDLGCPSDGACNMRFADNLQDKTVLINVASYVNSEGKRVSEINDIGAVLDFGDDASFPQPETFSSVLWNVYDSEEFTMCGGAGGPQMAGSVLVPNGSMTMQCPGLNGRVYVKGDVIQDRDGSEFHNYEFDPPCTLPLPSDPCEDTPAPVTPAPVTPSPVTPAPQTPAPVTPSPVTPAPQTPAPVTPAPVTPAPQTPAPVTPAPVTPAPQTPAPVTPAPVTPAPESPAPVTPAPESPAPVTPAPESPAPVTPAPQTPAPVTPAPQTPAPQTPAPVTPAPQEGPGTPAPQTPAPVTPAPQTPAPVTPAPQTPAPQTPAPVTPAPVTPAPQTGPGTPAPQTPAPVTPAPVTPAPITPAPVTPAPQTPVPVDVYTPAPTPNPTTPSPVDVYTPAPQATPAPQGTPAPQEPRGGICVMEGIMGSEFGTKCGHKGVGLVTSFPDLSAGSGNEHPDVVLEDIFFDIDVGSDSGRVLFRALNPYEEAVDMYVQYDKPYENVGQDICIGRPMVDDCEPVDEESFEAVCITHVKEGQQPFAIVTVYFVDQGNNLFNLSENGKVHECCEATGIDNDSVIVSHTFFISCTCPEPEAESARGLRGFV